MGLEERIREANESPTFRIQSLKLEAPPVLIKHPPINLDQKLELIEKKRQLIKPRIKTLEPAIAAIQARRLLVELKLGLNAVSHSHYDVGVPWWRASLADEAESDRFALMQALERTESVPGYDSIPNPNYGSYQATIYTHGSWGNTQLGFGQPMESPRRISVPSSRIVSRKLLGIAVEQEDSGIPYAYVFYNPEARSGKRYNDGAPLWLNRNISDITAEQRHTLTQPEFVEKYTTLTAYYEDLLLSQRFKPIPIDITNPHPAMAAIEDQLFSFALKLVVSEGRKSEWFRQSPESLAYLRSDKFQKLFK